ncbi:DNA-directed primase/polymerase protein isoform X1 [Cinnamomum micranthum f. kanehirae]|uniref:DNA-directed primase/polymerase protein isoform X1 n=1 Tax=Cinnamomum micranthum f. kanehirae TaxID=337451 RepID=A0A3S3NTP9_9MAGN|nr:DNA-directed primase/polymerase protein isoform X1 [Cinnamomum micranthum f. kanehirae]
MATPTEILQLISDDFQKGFKKLLEDNQRTQEGFNNLRIILQEEIQDVKQGSIAQEESTYSGSLSSRRAEKSQQNAADVQLLMQKFGPTTINAINFDHGKQISPVIFYGSHHVPPKRLSRLSRLLHEIHIDHVRVFSYQDQEVCMLAELFSNKIWDPGILVTYHLVSELGMAELRLKQIEMEISSLAASQEHMLKEMREMFTAMNAKFDSLLESHTLECGENSFNQYKMVEDEAKNASGKDFIMHLLV